MRGMSPSGHPVRPYPWIVDRPLDEPDALKDVPTVVQSLLKDEEDGPIMVTGFALVAEYIDGSGAANVAAWASDDPPWRITGLLSVADELLDLHVHDDEEIDDD